MRIRTFAAVALLSATVAAADVGPPPDVATRARGAGRVVVARVVDVQGRFAINRFGDQLIVSSALLEIVETLKGSPAPTVRVDIEGGTVGDLTLQVSDLPMLRAGERGVFFLDAAADGTHTPHDRGRGILKLSPADRVEGTTVTLDAVREQVRAGLVRGGR